jgi:hypothetical protein
MLPLPPSVFLTLVQIFVFFDFSPVFCVEETPPWMNEIFGDGTFNEDSSNYVAKHLSRQ